MFFSRFVDSCAANENAVKDLDFFFFSSCSSLPSQHPAQIKQTMQLNAGDVM